MLPASGAISFYLCNRCGKQLSEENCTSFTLWSGFYSNLPRKFTQIGGLLLDLLCFQGPPDIEQPQTGHITARTVTKALCRGERSPPLTHGLCSSSCSPGCSWLSLLQGPIASLHSTCCPPGRRSPFLRKCLWDVGIGMGLLPGDVFQRICCTPFRWILGLFRLSQFGFPKMKKTPPSHIIARYSLTWQNRGQYPRRSNYIHNPYFLRWSWRK